MQNHNKPAANPLIVLREEFEDSAFLYNPESGSTFGLNSLGVFIWKRLDGLHSEEDILKEVQDHCKNIPEAADAHLKGFIRSLLIQGLVEYRT
jgi:SynChlorMet cassette protein ScmD